MFDTPPGLAGFILTAWVQEAAFARGTFHKGYVGPIVENPDVQIHRHVGFRHLTRDVRNRNIHRHFGGSIRTAIVSSDSLARRSAAGSGQ
jgi:hypothetical protein